MYDLLLPKHVPSLELGDYDWRDGLALHRLPAAPIEASCQLVAPPLLLGASTPLFHRSVLDFLRECGAGNLQSVQVALRTPAAVLDDWHAVNVVGTIPLASFVLELPPVEVFAHRRQAGARAAMAHSAASAAAIARAPPLPRPTALITRLAEGNHPLLIRSDVMAQLDARFNREAGGAIVHRVRFDDLRFCDLYSDARFEALMAEAATALRT
ncbi:hypothetical protein ACW5EG_15550 [Luteimonas sp. A611]